MLCPGHSDRQEDCITFCFCRFMADKKRMNVALTRAKSALYIVAHMDSLKVRHTSFLTILK